MARSSISGILGLLLTVALVAVVSGLVVFYAFIRPQIPPALETETFVERLQLTQAQRAEVQAIDGQFQLERDRLMERFNATVEELAGLLLREDALTAEVEAAIGRVHEVHGALQALSVRRYFALLRVLPEEKRPEFRRIAADSLSHPE